MVSRNVNQSSVSFDYVTFNQAERLEDDHPLVHRALAGREHKPTHLHRLSDCPDTDPDFPFYFYLHDGGRIISSFAALPDRLHVRGETRRWAWAGALLTDPAYRGRGLGKIIISEAVRILHQRDIAWGGVFSTPAALHIYQKLNFSMPGYADRYLFPKSCRAVFKHHLKTPLLAAPADLAFRTMARAYMTLKGLPRKGARLGMQALELSFEDQNPLPADWPRPYYHALYHFNDDLPKLWWKIRVSPANRLFLVQESASGRRRGYFVLKNRLMKQPVLDRYKDFYLMTLLDFGVFDDDPALYSKIFHLAFGIFASSTAEIFEVVSSSPLMTEALRRSGFRRVGKGMSYVFTAPAQWELPVDTAEPTNWPLTHFCGDAFSFA